MTAESHIQRSGTAGCGGKKIGAGNDKTFSSLLFPIIIFLHCIFMHPLSYHLDFGGAESFDLLVSRPIPSVHPFFLPNLGRVAAR